VIATSRLAALLIGVLPLVAAHSASDTMNIKGSMATNHTSNVTSEAGPPSYFRHGHHSAWTYTHIGFMIVSWVFVLPAAIMLAIAKSRYRCLLSWSSMF
jgi:hypothetical protein